MHSYESKCKFLIENIEDVLGQVQNWTPKTFRIYRDVFSCDEKWRKVATQILNKMSGKSTTVDILKETFHQELYNSKDHLLIDLHSELLNKDVSMLVSTYKDLHDILSNEKSETLNRYSAL